MKTHLTARDFALILLIVAIWGFSFVPIKVALVEVPPFALAALRFVLAAFPLVFFVKAPAMPAAAVIAYGGAIGVFQFGLLFLGMKLGMPAGLSSLVIQMQVFFTIAFGIVVLHDRVRAENIVGAIVAAAGIVLLAVYKLQAGAGSTFVGFLMVLVAALAWGVGNIVAKRAAQRHGADMFALVVWSSLVPPLPLSLLAYWFEGGGAAFEALRDASLLTWGCALFLAWAATLFGFATWARLLHRYPTGLVSPFALLIPIFGLGSGALLLGERLSWLQAAGVALVLVGLVINVFGGRLRGPGGA